jgi:hypothetical protein
MTRPLPVLPTATTFCEATLPLFEGLSFYLDGNSKITRENGTYLNPKPNAFSLPAASVEPGPYRNADPAPRACPGSTPTCRSSCYVKGLAQHAPALYARYQENAEALATIFADSSGRMFSWSALKLGMWIEDNAPHGFRWHVSGDVLSLEHAEWIVNVCAVAADVPFWIYTRTLEAVGCLTTAPNLAVNVSADRDNFEAASEIALTHGARVCYLVTGDEPVPTLPTGSVLFPDYPRRERAGSSWFDALTHEQRRQVCPADTFSQSESARCGPCRKCF